MTTQPGGQFSTLGKTEQAGMAWPGLGIENWDDHVGHPLSSGTAT